MRKKHEFKVILQRCWLQIWQGVANIDAFSNSTLQANCHSAIRMDPKNVKGSCNFRFVFALKHFVIFENLLTNLVIKIDSSCCHKAMCHCQIVLCMQEWCPNLQHERC